MNQQQVIDVLKRINFGSHTPPVKLNVFAEAGAVVVAAQLEVIRLDTEKKGLIPDPMTWDRQVIDPATATEQSICDAAYSSVMYALGHEAKEHMKLNGRQAYEPHPTM